MQEHYLIYFASNAVTAITAIFLYILVRHALRRKKKRQKLREEQYRLLYEAMIEQAADPLKDAFTDKEILQKIKEEWAKKKNIN